jgi:tetratricopeptide (TPR) repeat protein
MTRRFFPLASAAALALTLVGSSAQAQERRLGTIDFPNSGAPPAQADFVEGMLLLHSFEFDDAARAFRRAQERDPAFAMAYWGEAMTYNHPLWQQQDKAAALAALARYAPTPEARRAKAPTPREAAYLATLDVLYGTGTKAERDAAYTDVMARLAAAYPEDLEARALWSLAILGSTDGRRDFATYMRAAAVAQPVFETNPDHPGAAHYLIHSFDDPVHAPLGLDAARAYSAIAPGAAHAQHMTSHIFVAMGMWDDVVAANIRARDVQNARNAELGQGPNVCGHYTSWLHYGWLMKGMLADAERGMAECRALVLSGGASGGEVSYFANMRARHVLDTQDWAAAERLSADVDHPAYHFVTGYAALKSGDRTGATTVLERLRRAFADGSNPRGTIMVQELEALLALDAGDGGRAVRLLTEAAELEVSLPFEFGPPASAKPPHELLGEVDLQLGHHADALAAFRTSLQFTPERAPSLVGVVAAAEALDQTAAADDARARLEQIRRSR